MSSFGTSVTVRGKGHSTEAGNTRLHAVRDTRRLRTTPAAFDKSKFHTVG